MPEVFTKCTIEPGTGSNEKSLSGINPERLVGDADSSNGVCSQIVSAVLLESYSVAKPSNGTIQHTD
jgi:hypothetical protein